MNKYLIVRFSSFGDIAQALPAAQFIRENDSPAEIHWLVRSDFANFAQCNKAIDRIWSLDRKSGFLGFLKLAREMRAQNFTHLYDAHNNLRSNLLRTYLRLTNFRLKILVRSKNRIRRLLLFKFRINLFENPFRGAYSFLTPLSFWFKNVSWPKNFNLESSEPLDQLSKKIPFPIDQAIVLAPSAAWDLKKWPVHYWQELIRRMPHGHFIVLGGEKDLICQDISSTDPARVLNLAGQLSWVQSAQLVAECETVISGDTGILHVADTLKKRTIAIIGPTAFGFPSQPTTLTAEVNLSCRPCTKDGRGRCHNKEYQKCLRDINPHLVVQLYNNLANKNS